MPESKSTVDDAEIARFSAMAETWWDPYGPFKPLHQIMPGRLAFIREQLVTHFSLDAESLTPLTGLTVLDIGCGGGLLSEAMARLGATVTAIDASEKNINIASQHAKQSGLSIEYQQATAESLARLNKQYDIVLNMEVIEHVADVPLFMQAASSLVKPEGIMLLSTLNKTLKAYVLAIIGAEYVLRWLPRGTHDWKKFLKPSQVMHYLRENGLQLKTLKGMVYNPLAQTWRLDEKDLDVNYLLAACKT